jgi:hypothetical protein
MLGCVGLECSVVAFLAVCAVWQQLRVFIFLRWVGGRQGVWLGVGPGRPLGVGVTAMAGGAIGGGTARVQGLNDSASCWPAHCCLLPTAGCQLCVSPAVQPALLPPPTSALVPGVLAHCRLALTHTLLPSLHCRR